MKKVLLALFVFGAFLLFPKINFAQKDYNSMWTKVDKSLNKGLPKSAKKDIDFIFKKAEAEKNYEQILKCYIFYLKARQEYEQNSFQSIVQQMENDLPKMPFPHNAMLHSMLADLYWEYYNNNEWKISDRTKINNPSQDIETWATEDFVNVIIKHFSMSLQNPTQLQKVDIDIYSDIIKKGTKPKFLRPTLYDFLVTKAIDFYKNKKITLTKPADYFQIKEDFYFASASEFANTKIDSKDTLSLHYNGMKLLQEWLKFRLSEKTKIAALIEADLYRLDFVKTFSVNNNMEKLYFDALKIMEKEYSQNTYNQYVKLEIADFYKNNASKYSFDDKITHKYKNYYQLAIDIYTKLAKNDKNDKLVKAKAQNSIIEIKQKHMSFKSEDVVLKNTAFPIRLSYVNIKKVYVEVRLMDYKKYENLSDEYDFDDLVQEIRKSNNLIKNYNFDLDGSEDFQRHSTELLVDGLITGGYVILLSTDPNFSNKESIICQKFIQVSNLAMVLGGENNKKYEHFILDRKNGTPIPNAKVKIYKTEYNYKQIEYVDKLVGTYTTDKNGYFLQKKSDKVRFLSQKYLIFSDNDFLYCQKVTYPNTSKERKQVNTKIFTDRKIYRPGQIVYYKGIVLEKDQKGSEILRNYNDEIIFYDANYQKITSSKFVTNEYGTFSGSFTIPKGILNGKMTLETDKGSITISVEEYKIPKFEVEINPVTEQYLVNDTVKITGFAQNYSGVKLNDATVEYKITRQDRWICYWEYSDNKVFLADGKISTNENGEFEIKFKAAPNLQFGRLPNLAFSYNIDVAVTDINGETHSANKTVTIGYNALLVSSTLKERVDLADIKNSNDFFDINTTTLDGLPVDVNGKLEIYSLEMPKNSYVKRIWEKPDNQIYSKNEWLQKMGAVEYENETDFETWKEKAVVWQQKFDTKISRKVKYSNLAKLKQGVYKFKILTQDIFGNKIEKEEFFVVYSTDSKQLPYKTNRWIVNVKTNCKPAETAKILIGSTDQTVVFYKVRKGAEIFETKMLKLNGNQKLIEIPVTEDMRGGFNVAFIWIAQNRIHQTNVNVSVPYSDKELDVEFVSFRNKLQPGEKDEWKIIIKNKESNEKVTAELLAGMYDASLDAFIDGRWSFSPFMYNYSYFKWKYSDFSANNSDNENFIYKKYISFETPYHKKFDWFGFHYSGFYGREKRIGYAVTSVGAEAEDGVYEYYEEEVYAEDDAGVQDKENGGELPPPPPPSPLSKGSSDKVQIRKNFNETVFFYPNLETNKDGEATISFTIPESLTRWKFQGFAHTQNLEYTIFEKEIVTQKPLMVVPNAPRFYRQGDTMTFASKVSNLSDGDLTGTVTLEFFDELSGKKVDIFAKSVNSAQNFEVKKEQSSVVSWQIIIPDDVQMLSYQIIAKSGNFSDGERKALPVLSNRILVTESLPLPIRAKQTKTFEFKKLIESANSSTIKTDKLTVEFTSKPAWYAVQALPYLIEYPYECAEQTFSRYYANTLASYIANSSPRIKAVFDTWRNYQPEALLSNLEKNQDLKQILLEETPWVLQAKSESQRKRNIGLLFDLNRMAYEKNKAVKKLQREQTVNGGWAWFKGMPENRYITQYIAEGIGHLRHLNVLSADDEILQMGKKAVAFCDREMYENYLKILESYKKSELNSYRVSAINIHYLYMRSFYSEVKLNKKYEVAYNFFYDKIKKEWTTYSIYNQALMSIIFYRNNDVSVAMDMIKSFKERAISDKELGMYWKESAGYYWYQNPIQTQTVMIEVFNEVAKENKITDELKIWLLKNKQTNDWKTTTTTSQAIYALLLTGGVDLLANSEIVPVQLGDKVINPAQNSDIETEAGTGYYKVTFEGDEVKPEWGKVKVKNSNNIVAWGAVYWQYFENIDKITAHETPLKLHKELYKETMSQNGAKLNLIKDDTKLNIGDKVIVRIELRVDRNMEYVHMKDMRAAGFEPINVFSRYKWQGGLGYYETTKDASTNFFIDYLPKGTYVFEYPLRVTTAGSFSNGITTIQCMYAPEFRSHSKGQRIKIN